MRIGRRRKEKEGEWKNDRRGEEGSKNGRRKGNGRESGRGRKEREGREKERVDSPVRPDVGGVNVD